MNVTPIGKQSRFNLDAAAMYLRLAYQAMMTDQALARVAMAELTPVTLAEKCLQLSMLCTMRACCLDDGKAPR